MTWFMYIAGAIWGYDTIWFLSDEFGFKSYQKYYYHRDPENFNGYVKYRFEMSAYLNNKSNSIDTNLISRMRHLMVGAITAQVCLPKLIMIVPDDDFITYLNFDGEAASQLYGKLLDWLMMQHDRLIATQKEYLPQKAKMPNSPKIIWIEPPLHENFNNMEQV